MSGLSKYIIKQNGTHFCGNIHAPTIFYGFIIGKGGKNLKRIEQKTNTKIKIPESRNHEMISVEGKLVDSVTEALSEIVKQINFGRSRLDWTHFFSVHASNNEIKSNFQTFKEMILSTYSTDKGIVEEVFQKSHRLHMTLGLLVLGNQYEINEIQEHVEEFKRQNKSLFQNPFPVYMKGLGFYGKDPSEVRVLYAKVHNDSNENRLQTLAEKLQDFLFDQKVISQKESVKLHMTLMNTSFLKNPFKRNGDQRKGFDCSNILEKHIDWDFGVFNMDELELLKMGSSTDIDYYVYVARFKTEDD